jgi:hypothetical protein
MSLVYAVQTTCISKTGGQSQEFLSGLIDSNEDLNIDIRDDDYWKDNAIDLLYACQEDGNIPDNVSIEQDYIIIVNYGYFQVDAA